MHLINIENVEQYEFKKIANVWEKTIRLRNALKNMIKRQSLSVFHIPGLIFTQRKDNQ